MQLNKEINEPVVDCAIFEVRIKDEDPLSISQGGDAPILKNINQVGFPQGIKQEFPEVLIDVYQHKTKKEPIATQKSTSTSDAPRNTKSIPYRTATRSKVVPTLKSLEAQRCKQSLLKCQNELKKKTAQFKNLQKHARRLKANNERMKQLLEKYKQKQIICESVLKDIAKNSKAANTIISHLMSNNN